MKNSLFVSALAALLILGGEQSPSAATNTASTVETLGVPWKIAKDPQNVGRDEQWFNAVAADAQDAPVPGIIQQVFPAYHGVAWYWHDFKIVGRPAGGGRVVLHFGAVDYLAEIWLNGTRVGGHEGGETPFEFDVTDLVKTGADNLLAVRVLNPTDEPIDGIKLGETPHRNKVVKHGPGSSYDSGGIMYPVQLRFLPPVYIDDLFTRPDGKTGRIAITLRIRNSGSSPVAGYLSLNLAPAAGGDELNALEQPAQFAPGTSEHELNIDVAQPHLWNLNDPFLYRVTATVAVNGQSPHQQSVRCGFRDFRVVDGWFCINGRRIFLKSTHTGNHMPIGQQLPPNPDFVRRDLINAKASGFNTVRFIGGVAYPEQLDFCDELGLMVYEENYASWLLADSPKMAERFDQGTAGMILRDRNHPSVTIWGLLNETEEGPVFRHAASFLPKLRELDPTRLVLLSSGRFDGLWSTGSVSNPGGQAWEYAWGSEAPGGTKHPTVSPSPAGAGDFHIYPKVPHTPETEKIIRELGEDQKPVFVSEYGIGSMFDVIGEWRHFEQAGARPDLEDSTSVQQQSEALAADWKRLGFDDVYPFPEDLLRESERLHARQRTIGFNLIRSNPKLCGFSLTGMLDHGMCGEGLWTFWREWKPSVFDAVSDGWSPLRWCLFANPMNAYAGRDLTLEAVLANEEVLKPGEYPARFRLFGPGGLVWEKSEVVKIPDSDPLAIPVIRESFQLNGPPGRYTFAANLERGGAPTGGRLEFQVTDPVDLPKLTGSAVAWGLDAKAQEWLGTHGLTIQPLTNTELAGAQLILVGTPTNAVGSRMWEELKMRMTGGATVLFLSPKLFVENKQAMAWLPLKNPGRCYTFDDWLYHKECVARRHPVFDGLQGPGIMDMDYYGPVIPHEVFEGIDTPDDTIAAAFATGYYALPGGYGSSILMGAWKSGQGRFILSTPYLLENLDTHPAADRLLVNLIHYAKKK